MKKPKRKVPGPKPERLRIEGNWRDAMKKSFQTQKPPAGWPKPEPKKHKKPNG